VTQPSLFHQAVTLHRQGQTAAAERLYRQIQSAQPGDFQSRHMLAVLLYQQRHFAEALAAAEDALRQQAGAAETHMLRGMILSDMGRPQDALASFAKVQALQPGSADAWYSSGQLLSALGRFGEAADMLAKALAIQPSAQGWNAHGAAAQQADRLADAVTSYEKAIALDSTQPVFHANRGRALQALKRLDEAVAAYGTALTLRPADTVSAYNRATALLNLKRHADALAAADHVLALAPNHAEAWKIRASAAHNLARFDEALNGYDRVTAMNPQDVEGWLGRAQVLQITHRFDEAHAALDHIQQLQPDYISAIAIRAGLLCEQGRLGEGFDAHRRHADLLWGTKPARTRDDPPEKKRHDAEQDAWRREQGLVADDRYHILGGERLAGPAVNPANAQAIAAQWKSSTPQIVVVDDLLTPEALAALRRFCLGSTIWLRHYAVGYLGAMTHHGFACPLLAQIAEEMQSTFPDILADQGLTMAWGFTYDSRLGGIRIHADQAAVNINFWLTPDEANNDPDHGGLIIWDKCAPAYWDIRKYNGDDDAVRAFLKETGARPVTVPYRANRAVIFDSDLFHETDAIDFKDGFLNRRMNVTMLFGRRTFYGT
jgi:tetratricopeptide (TPR) repeat protein